MVSTSFSQPHGVTAKEEQRQYRHVIFNNYCAVKVSQFHTCFSKNMYPMSGKPQQQWSQKEKNRTGTEKCNKERIKLNLKHREEGRTGVRKSRKNLWWHTANPQTAHTQNKFYVFHGKINYLSFWFTRLNDKSLNVELFLWNQFTTVGLMRITWEMLTVSLWIWEKNQTRHWFTMLSTVRGAFPQGMKKKKRSEKIVCVTRF